MARRRVPDDERYTRSPHRWRPAPYEISAAVERVWTDDLEAAWLRERPMDEIDFPARMIAEHALTVAYNEWARLYAPEYAASQGMTAREARYQYGRSPVPGAAAEPPPALDDLIALLLDGTLLAWHRSPALAA